LVLPKASLSAEHVITPSEISYEFAVSERDNYIALHDIVLDDGEILTNAASSITDRDLRRKITFVPAGMPVRGWGDPKARRNSFTAIHFGADAIPEPSRGRAARGFIGVATRARILYRCPTGSNTGKVGSRVACQRAVHEASRRNIMRPRNRRVGLWPTAVYPIHPGKAGPSTERHPPSPRLHRRASC